MIMEYDFRQRSGIVAVARDLYRSAPARARTLQGLRPYICPFEDLIRWFPSSGRVLDVGCGAGLFLGLGGRARPDVTGVGFDADAQAIAAAQGMAKRHFSDGRIAFRHSAVGDPWPTGPFDLVSMIDVLHHIPLSAQQGAIAQAYGHVGAGGIFLYKDMASRPFFRAWWNRFHDIAVAREWIHYRSIDEVEAWLRARGAEIVERSARVLGLYGHEWIVAKRPV
jgi:SAM-dependent methyltransferase